MILYQGGSIIGKNYIDLINQFEGVDTITKIHDIQPIVIEDSKESRSKIALLVKIGEPNFPGNPPRVHPQQVLLCDASELEKLSRKLYEYFRENPPPE